MCAPNYFRTPPPPPPPPPLFSNPRSAMVDSRAKAGARALCAWLKSCRISVEEVKGESFVKLLEALVGSVLVYGAELEVQL